VGRKMHHMDDKSKSVDIVFALLLIAIVFAAFFTFSPNVQPTPHRDSGIFLFVGQEINRGRIIYLDVWEIKAPLIYFINAFGLLLGNGSVWGVWALELCFFIGIMFLSYFLLRKNMGALESFLFSAASFLGIYLFMSGNFTEEYTLLFSMAMLFVFVRLALKSDKLWPYFLIGCFGGLAFEVKPSYIDVILTIVTIMIVLSLKKELRKFWRKLLFIFWGFLVINLITVAYFWSKNALGEYWIDVFVLNRYYSNLWLVEWIKALTSGISFIIKNPIVFLAIIAWLVGVLVILVSFRKKIFFFFQQKKSKWILFVIGIFFVALFTVSQVVGKDKAIGIVQWTFLVLAVFLITISLLQFTPKINKWVNKMNTRLKPEVPINLIDQEKLMLYTLGIVDFPITLGLITLSGKNYPHYFISLFPSILLILAGFYLYVSDMFQTARRKNLEIGILVCVFIVSCLSSFSQIISMIKDSGKPDARSQAAQYVKSHSDPSDTLLVWGNETVINFLADRESPTRYETQFAGYFKFPYQQNVIQTIQQQVTEHPPLWIIDTNDPFYPFIQMADKPSCLQANPAEGEGFMPLINFICRNYELKYTLEKYYFYERISP
jgi:hypothetical protein